MSLDTDSRRIGAIGDTGASPCMLVSDTLQAHEKLYLHLRENKQVYSNKVFTDSVQILETLRDMKSEIEGTAVKLEPVRVKEADLGKLKRLVLAQLAGSMTPEVKATLGDMITSLFQGSCKKVIFGGLITCPWYLATQTELGLQAKHNSIFVVYLNKDEQFFSPVNPHVREAQCEVVDHGWFYAAEAYHFAHHLLKGKARFVEAICLSESAALITEPEWMDLRQSVSVTGLTNLKGFLEQCRGQAVGTVGKKKKSGDFGLKDSATLLEFCESLRLLSHASQALQGRDLNLINVDADNYANQDQYAAESLDILQSLYEKSEDCTMNKHHLFEALMKWRRQVDSLMSGHKFTQPSSIQNILGSWLSRIRKGIFTPYAKELSESQLSTVRPLMERIGGSVSSMEPENILLVAQAGSYLYGLNTPESDVDFVVIYAEPIENVLSACGCIKESFESRGPTKSFEFGAYEARLLSEMLWKGSVVMLELVFSDNLEYISQPWKMLHMNRQLFVTERGIQQYMGLVKNNMVLIQNEKHKDTPREKKLFYQVFHKLFCVEQMLEGRVPEVKCTGEQKQFIMRIRKGPLKDDITRDKLYERAETKLAQLKQTLASRKTRLPENISYQFLLEWMLFVRGWSDPKCEQSSQT